MKKIEQFDHEEDWKSLAPLLSGIPKENPFEVPDNYFDALAGIISDRCIAEDQKVPFFHRLKGILIQVTERDYLLKPRMVMVYASCIILVFFGIKFFRNNSKQEQPLAKANVEVNDFSSMIESLDEESISDALAAKGFSTDEGKSVKENSSKKEMEDYLLNNNIDINLISKEL